MSVSNCASEPPFIKHYRALFYNSQKPELDEVVDEVELPVIDLSRLRSRASEMERQACKEAIVEASTDWGFFQVVNHGIGSKLLEEMRREQEKLFDLPFDIKAGSGIMNNSYRWGTPTATSLSQFSWSEAFHVPLANIKENCSYGVGNNMRQVMHKVGGAMLELSRTIARILAENLGQQKETITDMCSEETCFLRLNKYPPCPFASKVYGLTPHTDSDFLTILQQDLVGGLQLMKGSKWITVKPIPDALIVNVGDLFQAWSNDAYKSVEHKVVTNMKVQRYSLAFFMCPPNNCKIGTCKEPSPYKDFSFGQYRRQVQEDVKITGKKFGLSRFLL